MAEACRFDDKKVAALPVCVAPKLRKIGYKEMIRADIAAEPGNSGNSQRLKAFLIIGMDAVDFADYGFKALF